MKRIAIFALALLLIVPAALAVDTTLSATYTLLSSEVAPGGQTTVVLTLTNPSASVSIDQITLQLSGGPFISTTPTQIEVGGLQAKESKDVSVIIKADSDAESEVSYANVLATYYSPNRKTLNVNIPVSIQETLVLQINEINFDKQPEPGSTVVMNISIKNNGAGTARDLEIELAESDTFITDKSEDFIPSLPSKTVKNAVFTLTFDPDAEVGIYNIPVTLSYKNEDKSTSYTEEKNIGLKVSGSYDFIITLESQEIIAPGKPGIVTVKIANAGSAAANYMSASVPEWNSDIVYIGEIDSDDYETQTFLVTPTTDIGTGKKPMNLNLKYKDDFGQEQEIIYPITVTISNSGIYTAAHSPIGIVEVIILVILIFVGRWAYKKYIKKDHLKHKHRHPHKKGELGF